MGLLIHRTVAAEGTEGWQAVLPDLVREPVTEQLHLGGLTIADTTRCVVSVAGRPITDSVGQKVHGLTGGNPFLLGSWHGRWPPACATTSSCPCPCCKSSVNESTASRRKLRRLLVAAAVLGEQFPLPVAASLIDHPVVACLPMLEEAGRAGLLKPANAW